MAHPGFATCDSRGGHLAVRLSSSHLEPLFPARLPCSWHVARIWQMEDTHQGRGPPKTFLSGDGPSVGLWCPSGRGSYLKPAWQNEREVAVLSVS